MRRRKVPRYIVSPYSAAETFERLAHPGKFAYPQFYYGELLSFACVEWAVWFAERRGWFVFSDYMISQPEICVRAEMIRVDRRCSTDTIALVFSSVVSDPDNQRLLGECVRAGKTPQEYEESVLAAR